MSNHPDWTLIAATTVGCWAVGIVVLAVGLQWPKIKPYLWSGLAKSITAAANNAAVWLALAILFAIGPAVAASYLSANNQKSSSDSYLFVLGIAVTIFISAIAFLWSRKLVRPDLSQPQKDQTSTGGGFSIIANGEVLPPRWTDRIFIAQIAGESALSSLRNEHSIEFSVRVYNANEFAIELADIVGVITCKQVKPSVGAPVYLPETRLEHPTIRAENKIIHAFSEGRFAIFIHAPKNKAEMLMKALDQTPAVEFNFSGLTLSVRHSDTHETLPLKIWDGINVRRFSHRTDRIIFSAGKA